MKPTLLKKTTQIFLGIMFLLSGFSALAQAPVVDTFTPADNETGVYVYGGIEITFDETVTKGTGNIFIKRTADDTIFETIDVTTASVVVSFGIYGSINLSTDLEYNTEYYIQVPATAFKDVDDNFYAGISDTTTWSFTTEFVVNNWTGATDTNWTTPTNWSLGTVPVSTNNITIDNMATNAPTINSGTHVEVGMFEMDGSADSVELIIDAGGSLTVNDDFAVKEGALINLDGALTAKGTEAYVDEFNSSFISVNSGGSLIITGSYSDNDQDDAIYYKRTLATTNWYLISSPVTGEDTDDVHVASTFATAVAGNNRGFASYKNEDNSWNYAFQLMGLPFISTVDDADDELTSGKGYSVKLAAVGDIIFKGSMPDTDVNIAITDGVGSEFNLIGNPYPSYIPANTNADAVNNILTINTAQLQEETLWFWDQATSAYITFNQASASRFIAPAQGFFVNAKLTGGTFAFTEAMQSHQTTDVFSRTANDRFEINVSMTDGTSTKNTEIYYINGTTTAFDNGYDSSIFGGTSNAFAVYTQTVSSSQGRKLSIQSLPDTDYENMIIPIGVNATAGTEITFSAHAQNSPVGLDVYLENRTANTFTKLTDNENYTVTLSADANGVGQFYLRTTSSALGLENVTLEGISIYKTTNQTLRIIGLQTGKSTIKMFTILGKQVLQTSFNANGTKEIALPKLSAGIYLVNLQTAQGAMTKKIMIE